MVGLYILILGCVLFISGVILLISYKIRNFFNFDRFFLSSICSLLGTLLIIIGVAEIDQNNTEQFEVWLAPRISQFTTILEARAAWQTAINQHKEEEKYRFLAKEIAKRYMLPNQHQYCILSDRCPCCN